MTRIGFLTSTRTFGGAERQTLELARHLIAGGVDVTLIEAGHDQYSGRPALPGALTIVPAPDPARMTPPGWRRLLRRCGITTLVVVKGNFVKRWLGLDLALLLPGPRALAVEHGWPPDVPAGVADRSHRRLPSVGLWRGRQRASLAIHRRAMTHVIAVSHALRQRLIGGFGFAPERVTAIPNGIDTDRYRFVAADRAEVRGAWQVMDDRFVFGYVGRLGTEKRLDRLLRAFSQVRDSVPGPPPLLVLVGEGPREAALRALVGELDLSRDCRFAGPTDQAWKVYSAFDCVVSAGDQEGLGCAVLEASAAERPVVAVSAAGATETVRDGVTGFLASDGEDALARCMLRVAALNPQERARLGAAGRSHVGTNHDLRLQLERAASLIVNAGSSTRP